MGPKFSKDEFALFVAECRNKGMAMSGIGPEWSKNNDGMEVSHGSYILIENARGEERWSCYPAKSPCAQTLQAIVSARMRSGEACDLKIREFDSAALWPKSRQKMAQAM